MLLGMRSLLRMRCWLHAQDAWSPLHCAAQAGRAFVVRLLLEKGANIEAADGRQV